MGFLAAQTVMGQERGEAAGQRKHFPSLLFGFRIYLRFPSTDPEVVVERQANSWCLFALNEEFSDSLRGDEARLTQLTLTSSS